MDIFKGYKNPILIKTHQERINSHSLGRTAAYALMPSQGADPLVPMQVTLKANKAFTMKKKDLELQLKNITNEQSHSDSQEWANVDSLVGSKDTLEYRHSDYAHIKFR